MRERQPQDSLPDDEYDEWVDEEVDRRRDDELMRTLKSQKRKKENQ